MNIAKATVGLVVLSLLSLVPATARSESGSAELGVLMLGDQGKGTAGQTRVADAMFSFCQQQRCDFALLLGDNFYQSGVKSLSDPKFQTRYEAYYARFGIEFWAVLGNHDYGFGFSRGNIQALLDYTRISPSWRLPTRYYSFETQGVEFIGIDTVALPRDRAQQQWLEEKLKSPKSGYRMVLGHYPIHSGGQHGDTSYLRDEWSPKLCKSTDVYASGHDHHLEHLKTDCGVHLVLSGAGAEARPVTPTRHTLFAAETLGFSYLYKDKEKNLWVRYYDTALTQLAEFKIENRSN